MINIVLKIKNDFIIFVSVDFFSIQYDFRMNFCGSHKLVDWMIFVLFLCVSITKQYLRISINLICLQIVKSENKNLRPTWNQNKEKVETKSLFFG